MKKIFIFLYVSFGAILNVQVSMPLDTLYFQFEKVKEICKKDDGKLWGKSLYGPILVIDKASKKIVANESDCEGQLQKNGNVYVGKYPTDRIVGSTAIKFAGKSWLTLSYPFDTKDTFD